MVKPVRANPPLDGPVDRATPGWLAAALLFVVSGAVGLLYQVVWTRMFSTAFGSTTYALTAVLSAFMAGLALGSWCFGRFADRLRRPLLAYALLEVGIALAALVLPRAVAASEALCIAVYRAYPQSSWLLLLVRLMLAFAILLVPTFLMGATLPVLARHAVTSSLQLGRRVGGLYAANTLGATLGCLLAGFMLIETLGLSGTAKVAVGANLALALAFFLLHLAPASRRAPTAAGPAGAAVGRPTDLPALDRRRARVLLLAYGLAGFCTLAYEVLWFRVLVFQLKTTIYSFTLMLAAFLAGIALGSALFAALDGAGRGIRDPWRLFGRLEAAIGLLALATLPLFAGLEHVSARFTFDSWRHQMAVNALVATAIMLVPTTLMGMAFPAVCKLIAGGAGRAGTAVGSVYAANTVGCILGPLATGFVLVRLLGTQATLTAMAVLNLLLASMVLLAAPAAGPRAKRWDRIWIAAGTVAAAGAVFLLPGDLLFRFYNVGEKAFDERVEILHADEGLECITTVHRYPDGRRTIATGSINVAGTELTLRTTQKLQAHVPLLLHPAAREVLQIGFGSGETARIVTCYDVDRLDLVDISAGVLETSARFFADINGDVVLHPKFHPIIMDGANYVRMTDRTYDIILNDATWPYLSGCHALYSADHFAAGRARLKPGGIMTSWFPLDMAEYDFKVLLRTFHSVFPHVQVWVGLTHRNKHCLVLGSLEPVRIDAPGFRRRFFQFAGRDLGEVGLSQPVVLLSSLVMDEASFAAGVADVPVDTNDRPVLQFAASRRRGLDMLEAFRFMAAHRADVLPYLDGIDALGAEHAATFAENVAGAVAAAGHILRAVILREEMRPGDALELERALERFPNHPGALNMQRVTRRLAALDAAELAGRDPRDLLALAQECVKAGLDDKALEALEQAAAGAPGDPGVWFWRGVVLARLARFEEAAAAYEETVRLDPDLFEAWYNLGLVRVRSGKIARGVAAHREALRLRPDSEQARDSLRAAEERLEQEGPVPGGR